MLIDVIYIVFLFNFFGLFLIDHKTFYYYTNYFIALLTVSTIIFLAIWLIARISIYLILIFVGISHALASFLAFRKSLFENPYVKL